MIETASWGRRILALLVDWLACTLVVVLVLGRRAGASNPFAIYTMALFILESTVFTALVGGSFGKLATRLRVVRADGERTAGRPAPLPAAVGPGLPGRSRRWSSGRTAAACTTWSPGLGPSGWRTC